MVKSITFDGKEGYIGARYTDEDKPVRPGKNDWKYTTGHGEKRSFNEEKYNSDMERYREEMKVFKKVKGLYKVDCSELLVGRTFEFAPDKINLVFGPNASGKSTVLKCIASHAFCEDGFSKFVEPIDLSTTIGSNDYDEYLDGLKKQPSKMAGTSSLVEWDGSPIYYHNFENRPIYGYVGELVGSIIDNIGEELMYTIDKKKLSGGQNMFYQFEKLSKLMSKSVTYEDILKPYERYGKRPDENPWKIAYDVQLGYYKSMPMSFSEDGQNTYLFDEIDKSMDILNVYSLYTEVLPKLLDKFGKQIIVVSHSPIVLKPEITESVKYNFISMDNEYTEKCRQITN